jgi:hypothetical protein
MFELSDFHYLTFDRLFQIGCRLLQQLYVILLMSDGGLMLLNIVHFLVEELLKIIDLVKKVEVLVILLLLHLLELNILAPEELDPFVLALQVILIDEAVVVILSINLSLRKVLLRALPLLDVLRVDTLEQLSLYLLACDGSVFGEPLLSETVRWKLIRHSSIWALIITALPFLKVLLGFGERRGRLHVVQL